ncbi:hypothetical protein GLOIN_2v1766278 [Rhizophagus irregularis DAOM 181602=DAOM 197198]|uniref:RRM domain-containing protein n=1 Tax=Rhizophagus irregularis (strain DAOM 197198w) TaxID=1432141 RepID=A0A015JQ59_RHIIW|nr:hypothetical protein RirG_096160 [Rhizophagus irregularis DAOM 197198w]GBC34708.1 hypothetical protein GLOIN_2v1766278 [Rhizophagus irregularis DAOM 181602=DAOM 197198]
MSGNYAKRGRESHNPNSRKASRQERKNNNNSDNSSFDGENTIQQKRNRMITKNSMEEDYVADDQTADVGVDGLSSSPQQNISGENTLTSSPKKSATPIAPSHVASSGNVDASMHAPLNKDLQRPSNASPNLDTNGAPDGDLTPDPVVTLALTRNDFQAAAASNAAPESLKKFPTNKALIEAVNNLFLETYESFTGKAHMTGSGEAKRLVIHFHTAEARNLCIGSTHSEFPDLIFHAHDPRQLRSNENLQAIQVTNIPFFIKKDNLMAYFKKFGNITSCRLFSRSNAKVQQARIVYDHADSIVRFTDQWAVYCFSTCLRITPCFYTVDQKAVRRQYVATFTQLPPNVKDINLAPLTRDLGAKAVNIPLSLNSYKPKRWAYVTFNSQETIDAAMEQTISFQGHTRGRSRTRDPVAKLKERFNVNQPHCSNSKSANARSHSRSRSKSKDRSASNSGRDNNISHDRTNNDNNRNKSNPSISRRARHNSKERLVSFSSSSRSTARPLPRQTPNSALSPDDANNILNHLRELQCEVANFHKRISALELADQRMTRIESHLGLDPLPMPNEPEPDLMQEDASVTHVPLNIQSSAKFFSPPKSILTRPSSTITIVPNMSLPPSHLSPNAPPFTLISSTQEEINDLKNSRVVIESKLDQLTGYIKQFISSIGGAPLEQADSASSV